MKETKRKKLEAAGWRVGSADEFLGLSGAESRSVADRLRKDGDGLRVPDGWTLEEMPRDPDHALVTTPPPGRYMATIDWRLRGFRVGCTTYGRLVGEEWNKRRKKYGGRGWRQAIVDDAVSHLREVLR